jgi:hypothetical protein
MKFIKTLMAISVAAAALAVTTDAAAEAKHGWGGSHGGYAHVGYRGHGGHWHGGPRLGLYIGAPVFWGSPYWGGPWYDSPRVIYREVIREPEVIETVREVPAPSDSASNAPGAPTQGPLYMNYCASAKAYFPKVQSCPEGWKFIAPNQ